MIVCCMGIMDVGESNGATDVFPERLDRALGRLGVGHLRHGGRRSAKHPHPRLS